MQLGKVGMIYTFYFSGSITHKKNVFTTHTKPLFIRSGVENELQASLPPLCPKYIDLKALASE